MSYLCLTLGALIREEDRIPFEGCFRTQPCKYEECFQHHVFKLTAKSQADTGETTSPNVTLSSVINLYASYEGSNKYLVPRFATARMSSGLMPLAKLPPISERKKGLRPLT